MTKIQTVKDLKEALNNVDDNLPIFMGVWNGCTDTYALADYIIDIPYANLENDFYGTRGKMDKRLFNKEYLNQNVIYIGTYFHRNIKNKEIDCGSNPNIPIELINGEDGDHDLFWKANKFVYNNVNKCWEFILEDGCIIQYYVETKTLVADNFKYHWEGECIGIEDFFNVMKACKIEKYWRIG